MTTSSSELFTGALTYIAARRAQPFTFTSYESIKADILASLAVSLPNWTQSPDDPQYKAVENFAYRLFIQSNRNIETLRQSLLPFATGAYLDDIAVQHGIIRASGESDDDLLRAVLLQLRGAVPNTDDGTLAFASLWGRESANPLLTDVGLGKAYTTSGVTKTVYPLPALTTAQKASLTLYLNNSARRGSTETVVVADATESTYTITAALTYDNTVTDVGDLETRVRTSVYAYLAASDNIGGRVTRSQIVGALVVPGVITATLTAPAADKASVAGTYYTCQANATAVALTFTST